MSNDSKYFISCCSAEFGSYRTRLQDLFEPRLAAKVVIQEDLPAGRATLLENLYNCIQDCDAVLHLIGDDAGHCPTENEIKEVIAMCPGIDRLFDCDPSEYSYTQWECYFAIQFNVPCYVFVAEKHTRREARWCPDRHNTESQHAHLVRLKSVGKDFRSIAFDDPEDLAKLFERALASPQVIPRIAVKWPSVARPVTRIANRHDEIDAFLKDIISGSRSVMLVTGESGDGKSTLLAEFERIAETVPRVAVASADFHGSPSLDSLLNGVARRLSLPMRRVSLGAPLYRGVFLEQISRVTRPTLILVDTYEDADSDAKRWIENHLLGCVTVTDAVCFVIAGKRIPGPSQHQKWTRVATWREIGRIEDHSHWLAYANSLGLNLPEDHIELLVSATYGKPSQTSDLIHNLADQQPPRVKHGP